MADILVNKVTLIESTLISSDKRHLTPKKRGFLNAGTDIFLKSISAKGVIAGTVKEKGNPVSRRVFCYLRKSGALIDITNSDANGDYIFTNLAEDLDYYVVSLDENGDKVQYNAVIQDLIKAKKVAT